MFNHFRDNVNPAPLFTIRLYQTLVLLQDPLRKSLDTFDLSEVYNELIRLNANKFTDILLESEHWQLRSWDTEQPLSTAESRAAEKVRRAKRDKIALLCLKALKSKYDVQVNVEEWLFGFESDLVVRINPGADDQKIINIEFDGASHDNKTKQLFCERRDRYFFEQQGIIVIRLKESITNLHMMNDAQIIDLFLNIVGEI